MTIIFFIQWCEVLIKRNLTSENVSIFRERLIYRGYVDIDIFELEHTLQKL